MTVGREASDGSVCDNAAIHPAPSASPEPRPASPVRILIVDDDPNAREFMARALTRDGLVVDTASSGDDALRQLRAVRFDCVVVDLRMPGMDGQELHRLTEETDPDQARRFIFVTGDTFSAETLEFLDAPPEPSLMMKPVDLTALRQCVADLLEALTEGEKKDGGAGSAP